MIEGPVAFERFKERCEEHDASQHVQADVPYPFGKRTKKKPARKARDDGIERRISAQSFGGVP
jgi:hypothetical protein